MNLFILLTASLICVVSAAPQWPYRDNMENYYYGYQQKEHKTNHYRTIMEEDDEHDENVGRQDLKLVASGQSSTSPQALDETAKKPESVQVIETGSAKPVAQQANNPLLTAPNNQQATQPFVNQQPQQQPPAFPPAAQPPRPATPPEDEDEEEEDSDEEEEADEDEETAGDDEDDNQESEEEEEEDRRRQLNVTESGNATLANVTTTVKPYRIKDADKPAPVVQQQQQQQTIEALVPGYVTDQGEVLVPFDTVSGGQAGPVSIIPDPTGQQLSNKLEKTVPAQEQTPKFFQPASNNKQIYYSSAPPPGSIFTFDDDNNVDRFRADDSSEEEDVQDDDDSESAEDEAPVRPPLQFVKASGASGEDDEAESLGIIRSRMGYNFPGSRSPSYYYNPYVNQRYYEMEQQQERYYNGPYAAPYYQRRYSPEYSMMENGPRNQQQQRPRPPQYYQQQQQFSSGYTRDPIFYYRPDDGQKNVKVIPVANFDLSVEHDEQSGELRPVIHPTYYGGNKPQNQQPMRPPQQPKRKVPAQRRPTVAKPNLIAVYNVREQFNPSVIRQRNLKKNAHNNHNNKSKTSDPLGILEKTKKM